MTKLENFNFIPYGKQNIDNDDINAVIDVLKSDFLTQGQQVPLFENNVSGYCGANHAIAVNSATSALHIACMSLGLSQGDILWTSPISFAASSNVALYCNATVNFIDIDPLTFNICPNKLRDQLIKAKHDNRLPKIIIPVHLCGQSPDMEPIFRLSQEFGFHIIEDASHAIGGSYKDKKIGSCEFSDITVFSFHPVKIITTGEGGMALTNSSSLAKRMELFRSHGITRDISLMDRKDMPAWYYEQLELGYNYRMTDISAALGVSQFKKLDEFVAERNRLALVYNDILSDAKLIKQTVLPDCFSSFHLYIIQIDKQLPIDTRDRLFSFMRSKKIGVNLHYQPIYEHPFYKKLDMQFSKCENADHFGKTSISLPLYPGLTVDEQHRVSHVIDQFFHASS